MRRYLLLLPTTLLAAATVAPAQPVPAEDDRAALEQKAIALNQQATTLWQQGRLTQAVPQAEEALALRRRLYPPDRFAQGHPALAQSLSLLGLLRQDQGDLDRAEPLLREGLAAYRKLYPPARAPAGNFSLATSLCNLGHLLHMRGEIDKAEPLLRESLAMHRRLSPQGNAQVAHTLECVCMVLRERNDLAEAERHCREALALYRALFPPGRFPDGHPRLAGCLDNLALILQDKSDLGAAQEHCRKALAMYRELYPVERFPAGHHDLAVCAHNMARVLQAQGDLAGAERLRREALATYQTLYPAAKYPAGHPELLHTLNDLGIVVHARGDLERAEPLLRGALEMSRKLFPAARFPNGHSDVVLCLNSLAMLLQTRGDLEEAELLLREALAMQRKRYPATTFPNGHTQLALSLNSLAILLQRRQDLKQPEPLYREALAMQRKLYPEDRFPEGHAALASTLNNLGTLLLLRGDLEAAEAELRASLAMQRKLHPPARFPIGHTALAEAIRHLGALLAMRGDRAGAAPLLHEAAESQQLLLETFLTGAAEAEALNHLANLPLAADVYLSVTRNQPEHDANAHALIWNGRAMLARWLGQRRYAVLAADAPATRDLARQLADTRRALAALLLSQSAANDAKGDNLRRLCDRKEELEKDLANRLPALAALLQTTRRGPDALRKELPAGTALVEVRRYLRFTYDRNKPGLEGERVFHYLAFVLGPGQPVCRVELGPAADIEKDWSTWRTALLADGDERGAAARFAERCWKPVAGRFAAGTHTVYLVPDGPLTQVPWGALPVGGTRRILLEDHALAILPHGQLLLDALVGPERPIPEKGQFLAVGAVTYDEAAGGPARAATEDGLHRAPRPEAKKLFWPALPATGRELDRVLALAGARLTVERRGGKASTSQLLIDLPQARWAHMATHGFFADALFRSLLQLSEKDYERGERGERIGVGARNPLVLSGLVLAGANVPAKDPLKDDGGILTAESIAGLNLDGLELAVLSACETGLGEVAGGEGVFGLQRAFHIAGARNVVASLWKVDDEATAALMSLFYHNLWQEKMTALQSLRQAQLTIYRHPDRVPALARERGPDFAKVVRQPAAPTGQTRAAARLWAGFVLSGPGR